MATGCSISAASNPEQRVSITGDVWGVVHDVHHL
jgi:hypothetical protein